MVEERASALPIGAIERLSASNTGTSIALFIGTSFFCLNAVESFCGNAV